MEKKAKKFVALLAKKFTDAAPLHRDQTDVFSSVLDSLKEGRLKSELQENFHKYQKTFNSQLEACSLENEKQDSSTDQSFVMCCHKVADRLGSLTMTSPELVEWTEKALNRGDNSKLAHPELQNLASLLCCRDDYGSLVNTMFLVLSLQDKVEAVVAQPDHSRCITLQKELRVLLIFFHIKHLSVSKSSNKCKASRTQKYEDILASLISLYVDLVMVTARSAGDQATVGRELCSFVCLLLSQWPEHGVDVLLQMSTPSPPDGPTILPLARKCLKTPPVKLTNQTFSKFVICTRSFIETFQEEVIDIRQIAESIKAPASYLAWLREQKGDILEDFPEDRKFKGRVITRFLLHEADSALIDCLLDILTEDLPCSGEATLDSLHEQPEEMSSPEIPGQSDTPLFFVDTKGKNTDKSLAASDTQASDVDHKMLTGDDVEVIEVDLSGFDLQRAEVTGIDNERADDMVDMEEEELSNAAEDSDVEIRIGDDAENPHADSDDLKLDNNESDAADHNESDYADSNKSDDAGNNESDDADNNESDDAENNESDDAGNNESDDADSLASGQSGKRNIDEDDLDPPADPENVGISILAVKRTRPKTPIRSKLRSLPRSSRLWQTPTRLSRVRTRSMSSVDNDNGRSAVLQEGGQLGGDVSEQDEASPVESTSSLSRLRRHDETPRACRLCAEPHSPSGGSTTPHRSAKRAESDAKHSDSKKPKLNQQVETGTETAGVGGGGAALADSQPSFPPKSSPLTGSRKTGGSTKPTRKLRSLALSKSQKYNLRRKSAA